MEDEVQRSASAAGRRSKVAALIDEYGLDGMGGELERRWTADDDSRLSLRDLATHFNRRLVAQALSSAGVQALDGDANSVYRTLSRDGGSEAELTRTRRRLEREGVNVESLVEDFVSYQAIRTYLKDHRDAEYSPTQEDRVEKEKENLQRLRSRTTAVTESKLDLLRKNSELRLGEFRTLVSANIVCEDCGAQYEVVELLERGGCDCEQ